MLRRAITTANLALDASDRHWIPVRRNWRLNERHYGALQGLDKAATREKYGDEQFMLWRRSFDTPPPPIEPGSEFDQAGDPRYAGVEVPATECLDDVIPRMMPYWEGEIQDDLRAGRTVLVTAHGNSLRALVKHLDGISDDDIAGLNIPTGMPLVYQLGDDFMPTARAGTSTPRRPPRRPLPWRTRAAEARRRRCRLPGSRVRQHRDPAVADAVVGAEQVGALGRHRVVDGAPGRVPRARAGRPRRVGVDDRPRRPRGRPSGRPSRPVAGSGSSPRAGRWLPDPGR